MATLAIHPEDPSTCFLKPIYSKNTKWDVITGFIKKSELIAEFEKAENLIIMGHGDLKGLFGVNYSSKYIIDSTFCNLVESKNSLLFWCNADEFVSKNKLNFNFLYIFDRFLKKWPPGHPK